MHNPAPKIVIAIDSYKGCLSSLEAANSVARGIHRVLPEAKIIKVPVADGGEGSLQALVDASCGFLESTLSYDPIHRKIKTKFGLTPDRKTAFIEVAASIGLTLVEKNLRKPLTSSSYGVGQQIKAALDLGVRNFIICLGGSATTDGGAGMLSALGVEFLQDNLKLKATPLSLANLNRISLSNLDKRLQESTFLVASDVLNPLTGPNGAAFTFSPQKGATPKEVAFLDDFLIRLANIYEKTTNKKILKEPKMGAAGGITAALVAFFNAKIVRGINLILDYLEFEQLIQGADLIITGEGSLDKQSISGKTPLGVCEYGNKYNIPVIALAGKVLTEPGLFLSHGFKAVFSITPGPISLEESLSKGDELLAFSAENLANIIFNI